MRTLTIIISGLVCVAVSGCMVPKDDFDKVSAELTNCQQLVKEANDAHLKVAAEKRDTQTTLRETQAKIAPTQKELNKVKKQLLESQETNKKDITALAEKNESLQTQLETAVSDAKKAQNELKACQSELLVANKNNQKQQATIDNQNLTIKGLRKGNANVKKNSVPEPEK